MYSLLGLVLMYWGARMLVTETDITQPAMFFGGILLLIVGWNIFAYSLELPLDTGRAFG